jgi:hypothetical protein
VVGHDQIDDVCSGHPLLRMFQVLLLIAISAGVETTYGGANPETSFRAAALPSTSSRPGRNPEVRGATTLAVTSNLLPRRVKMAPLHSAAEVTR